MHGGLYMLQQEQQPAPVFHGSAYGGFAAGSLMADAPVFDGADGTANQSVAGADDGWGNRTDNVDDGW